MKQFSCGDVVPGCGAQFTDETIEDVLAQVAAHAQADHGMETVSPQLAEQIKASIR